MADFRPETTVYIFKATGVDDGNQPYFESEGAKLEWYNAHNPRSYSEYTYQRANRDFIRVQDKADQLREYDMMCFSNSEGRYIFCRIEEVEFINPNTVDIYYTIDYMQTYIDVCNFGKCWVEREMVENDWNGNNPNLENILEEGIETGPKIRGWVTNSIGELFAGRKVIVLSALNREAQPFVNSGWTSGDFTFPHALNEWEFTSGTFDVLGEIIARYAEKGVLDAIVGVYLVPTIGQQETTSIGINWQNINGYKPVNAKCWSSEFVHWSLSNGMGEETQLKAEYLQNENSIDFTIWSDFCGGTGGSFIYPRNYEYEVGTALTESMSWGLFMPWNCQVPYAGSGYYNWLGQNAGSIGAGILGDVIAGGITGAFISPNPAGVIAGAGIGVGKSILSATGKMRDSYVAPAYMMAPGKSSGMAWFLHMAKFDLHMVSPTRGALKSIDNYLSKFGYRVNMFKKPNVNTRPKWNYVKTVGAVCRGLFGKKAQEFMQSLMDNGVTFWHLSPGENIGDDWNIEENKE